MALSTYDELRASLAGWLHRRDVATTATGVGVDNVVDDWIALFEAEANATLRLRVMESDEDITWVVGSRHIALPAGYLEPLGLWIIWSAGQEPQELNNQVPVRQLRRGVVNGPPCRWAIDGTNLTFDNPADQAYAGTFRMLKAFALSDVSQTNWLLTNYPNLYLYGSLRHSPMYVNKDERAPGWDRMYGQALKTLEDKEERSNALVALTSDPALVGRRTFNINRG